MITVEQARAWRAKLDSIIGTLADEQALETIELYPAWRQGLTVVVDERRRYNDKLYRCVQAHTTQADWQPDVTPALWVEVSLDEWAEWVQPTGAHDAYSLGAKVSHNGQHWISDIAANTYEPSVYGWSMVE